MSIDVVDLKAFYQSLLSKNIHFVYQEILSKLRINNSASTTLFVGFGAPYADKTKNEFLLMLAHIGVLAWPDSKNNRAFLAYENAWPFVDGMFDEIIIMHGLEHAQDAGNILAECYRSLRPEGRLIVIAPNRRSVWVRNDSSTPFGFCYPYTLTQLSMILKKHNFVLVEVARGLYTLPYKSWTGKIWSWIFSCLASKTLQKFSGLVGVAAIKRVHAGIPLKKAHKRMLIAQTATSV